jgi:hypothetical protein
MHQRRGLVNTHVGPAQRSAQVQVSASIIFRMCYHQGQGRPAGVWILLRCLWAAAGLPAGGTRSTTTID